MILDRFDSLTKSLPTSTRRGAVRLLAGAPVAGALGALLPAPDRARARKPARKRHNKHRNARCPDCVCPPDSRLAADDACRSERGVAVRGECECAWINSGDVTPFHCGGNCVCMLTTEGAGFCGDGPPFPDTGDSCASSADCPPLVGPSGSLARACVVWADLGSICWVACPPARP